LPGLLFFWETRVSRGQGVKGTGLLTPGSPAPTVPQFSYGRRRSGQRAFGQIEMRSRRSAEPRPPFEYYPLRGLL